MHSPSKEKFLYVKPKIVTAFCGAIILAFACGCSEKPAAKPASVDLTDAADAPIVTNFTTILEAESLVADGSFVPVELEDASGKKAMRIPEQAHCAKTTGGDTPKPVGSLSAEFRTSEVKTVAIWLRVKWTGTCSNSFTVELPNGMKKTITSSTYNTWLWLPAVKKMELDVGKQTIGVDAREFGTLIDQIFITDDLERTPRGIESDYSQL